MARIILLCPRGSTTGGPEALHQLAAAFRSFGADVYLWDPTLQIVNEASSISAYFNRYDVDWTDLAPESGDTIVIPEIFCKYLDEYYDVCHCILWWLSVDNFFKSDIPIELLIDRYPRLVHIVQSKYALDFLENKGIIASMLVTDFINDNIVNRAEEFVTQRRTRENTFDIAVNPKKGYERTQKVLERLSDLKVIELENMSRQQLVVALSSSTIYLDLGNHPGMDRIPREASILGCTVMTNLRGSAGNEIDVPLERDTYKIHDQDLGFEEVISERVLNVLKSPDSSFANQSDYRSWVIGSKHRFFREARVLLNSITIYEL